MHKAVAVTTFLLAAAAAVAVEPGNAPPNLSPDGLAALQASSAGRSAEASATRESTELRRLRKVEAIEAWEGQALQAHQHVLEAIMAQQVSLISKEKQLIRQEQEQIAELNHTSAFYRVFGGAPNLAAIVTHHSMIQALAALTGIRAFLPITVVALGCKTVEDQHDFPFQFQKEFSWLDEWPTIATLFALAALEIVLDATRGADEFVDSVMLIVKPAVAWFIAMAPLHPESVGNGYHYALIAAINAELLAFVKMSYTARINQVSGEGKKRSTLEDMAVVALTAQVLKFPVASPGVIVLGVMLFLGWLLSPGQAKVGKQLK